ncbi:alpha/beta hydrolase [Hazenella sp. IB182353]|uniref:alpha/beta hydrolase n=1 Tax=Polycladospora coralii TaxID=2771432 RepID=UPI0017474B91|nr:alpha/beta hydrolase [Polycladospora coralii]MBS7530034.1 alpha/beta hydrolase [Polycladospora coralii]
MAHSSFFFEATDGKSIFVNKWISNDNPKGIIQLAHGMGEHSGRYAHFAEELNRNGYIVYANDHRGHGQTADSKEELGHFGDENGWEQTVSDMGHLSTIIKKDHVGLPLFLFGHSMGSFLARRYIQRFGDEIKGLILSGTGSDQGIVSTLGIQVAKLEVAIKGGRTRSVLMNELSFGQFNRKFKPTRTPYDWLSRDEEVVNQYILDPLCGEISTAAFFRDLLNGVKKLDQPDLLAQAPKSLPIYFFSGEEDPVGANTKGVYKTIDHYKKAGFKHIEYRFYQNGRHEMLNELNKEEVYQDIIEWLGRYNH